MANADFSSSKELPFDRPPTPPDRSRRDNDHPHPLRASPPFEPTEDSDVGNAASHRMPANPPSSPAMLSEPCSRSASPRPAHRRSRSPMSPPTTPPPTVPLIQVKAAFAFSRRLVKSKKLSSAVHGTLTQPVIYQLSDDD